MKKYRKLAVIVLAMAAITAAITGCEENKTENPLTYTLSQDGSYYEAAALRENNLTTQSITVPASYEGKPVAIAEQAFYALPELVSVTVEGTSYEIPGRAFMNCPKLETVILKGNAAVGENCFRSCKSLKSITFGEGIQFVGNACVVECPTLETVVIGDACTAIGANAFKNCHNLKNVVLGKNIEKIAPYAFAYTENLTSIQFPAEKPLWIGDYAFSHSGLLEVHLPANVTLGEYVFDHLAWDEVGGYSKCKAVYFYATEPTVENLGTNAIGYTWDRMETDDPQLEAFKVYVPEEAEDAYYDLMIDECDESWKRCVLDQDKLKTFEN